MRKCRGKRTYETAEIADRELEEIRKAKTNTKKPTRSYKCDACPFYHLTSKPDNNISTKLKLKNAFRKFLS